MAGMKKSDVEDTWKKWQAPGAPQVRLYSRAELLAELERYHVHPSVSESDLRYWEYWGVLPRPVRQKHKGKVVATYPLWMITLVRGVRDLQAAGKTLGEMRPLLQDEALRISAPSANSRMLTVGLPPVSRVHERVPLHPERLHTLTHTQRDTALMLADMLIAAIVNPDPWEPGGNQPGDLDPPLERPAIRRAELTLTDDRGRRVTIDLPLEYDDDLPTES
jgi:hypothetical protein